MLAKRLMAAKGAALAQLEYRTAVSSTTNATSYTFTSVDIGTASADRLVIVVVHVVTASGVIDITGVTVAGVSGTRQVINASAALRMAIFTALVPTGSTGNIVVTTDVTASNITISTYTLKNYNSSIPENTLATSGTPTATGNLTFGAGGAVVAGSISGTAATTTSWSSPLTENYDVVVEVRPRSGASASSLSAQTLSVSATASPSAITQMVAAAWR